MEKRKERVRKIKKGRQKRKQRDGETKLEGERCEEEKEKKEDGIEMDTMA